MPTATRKTGLRVVCTTTTAAKSAYPSQASEVMRGLYLSDWQTASDAVQLKKLGITHIVSALPGVVDLPPFYSAQQKLQIPIEDMPFVEIIPYLDGAAMWIENALRSHPDAKVLVHCYMGASRSSTIVCAYLMRCKRWKLEQTLDFLKRVRAIAEPNCGFVMQLREYEKSLQS